MRHTHHKSTHRSINTSKYSPFNRIVTALCILLLISLTLNVMLLSQQSLIINDDVPEMDYRIGYNKDVDCDDNSPPIINQQRSLRDEVLDSISRDPHIKKLPLKNSKYDPNPCHFNASLKNRIYLYDIPYHMREIPRGSWYSRFVGLDNYNNTESLNFGFGQKMYAHDWSRKDIHLTHMHVLEIIFNERLKVDDYYITNNPDQAMLFHIPYPFGLHYRFWERTESKRIAKHHLQLQSWLNNNAIYRKYFIDIETRRPHMLTFGRIAYETHRLEKMGSQFFKIHGGDITKYWMLSIDRNCHGDPPSCWKRISMPHPSNFHPQNVKSLKMLINRLKETFR
eukprot:221589_1